ncbi:hypothetical protein [uncultured Enterococcus sp.]|uniref:hypothetical protein n=1 Tax=uncultured Enterococcus sp. TaxID=167972 RepID=UPI0028F02C58|nr:hypothetical protein [uncultured Enterococcus sp.]
MKYKRKVALLIVIGVSVSSLVLVVKAVIALPCLSFLYMQFDDYCYETRYGGEDNGSTRSF